MSVYMTEEEQLLAIKKWWQNYSSIILLSLSLIMLVIGGYRYWSWHTEKVSTQASNAYEHLMVAYANNREQEVRSYANNLIKNHNKTVYADSARLILAKLWVGKDDYKNAARFLTAVEQQSRVPALRQIARIRSARLLIAKKLYSKALEQLSVMDDPAYASLVSELQGDIYASTGHYKQAEIAYKKAIVDTNTTGVGNLFLELKSNELSQLTQSMQQKGKRVKAV